MTAILEHFPAVVQDLFLTVPDQINAEMDRPFCQRRRSLDPSSFVRTLVFGWLDDPDASLYDLADYATTLGSPLSESGLRQRFTPSAVALLQGVLDSALQPLLFGQQAPVDLLQRFNGVYVFDSSVLPMPACLVHECKGCGNHSGLLNSACKVLLGLEISTGGLVQIDLFEARQPDQKLGPHCLPLPEGALRLRDLGFFCLAELRQQQEQGVYYLTRADPRVVVRHGGGQAQTLMQFLSDKGAQVDVRVEVGSRERLPCRLIAWRVPEAVAQRRRQKRQEWCQRKQRRRKKAQGRGKKVAKGQTKRQARSKCPPRAPTAEQLQMCEWVVALSNVPEEKMSVQEAEALLRARWQIELLIKVWKGSGQLEGIKANKPARAKCELLAKLLGQLVAHWAILGSGRVYLQVNVTRATRKVKKYAERLGQALGQGPEAFAGVWQELCLRLQREGRRRQGRKRPSTEQRLNGSFLPWQCDDAA